MSTTSTQPTAFSAGASMSVALERGINLGSAFERVSHSTRPARLRPLLLSFRNRGFRHVRIPVTWMGSDMTTSRLTDAQFMADLDDAIRYAISIGLTVILNTHHEGWINDGYTGATQQDAAFRGLWTAIARRYNAHPTNRLIFEVLNEPHGVFGDWIGGAHPSDERALQLTRRINDVGYQAIRAVNRQRIVCFQPNALGNSWAMSATYPTRASLPGGGLDPNIIMTVHTYDPWGFCGQDGTNAFYTQAPSGEEWWPALKRDVDGRFEALARWHASVGGNAVCGVAVGEFGVGRRTSATRADRNTDLVRRYYAYTTFVLRMTYRWAATAWCDSNWGWFVLSEVSDAGVVTYPFGLVNAMFPPYPSFT